MADEGVLTKDACYSTGTHCPKNKKPLLERGASYVKALVSILFFQGTSRTPFVFTQDGGSVSYRTLG
jgi:hypothetical protein